MRIIAGALLALALGSGSAVGQEVEKEWIIPCKVTGASVLVVDGPLARSHESFGDRKVGDILYLRMASRVGWFMASLTGESEDDIIFRRLNEHIDMSIDKSAFKGRVYESIKSNDLNIYENSWVLRSFMWQTLHIHRYFKSDWRGMISVTGPEISGLLSLDCMNSGDDFDDIIDHLKVVLGNAN